MAISGGAHRELAENVSAADWEPVRGEVALVRQQGILELPAGQRLHRPGQSLSHVRFSRNGESIAFIQHSSNTNDGAVGVFNLRQQRTAVLSDGWQSLWGLAWSPAGDEVWFTGSRDGRGRGIYAVTQEGRLRLLFRETGMLTLHDVARDQRMLLARDELEGGVLVIGKGVSQERNLAAYGGSLSVDLSSDGSAVLMTGTDQGTGSASVYLRKIDGSPPVRLGEGEATALSPDGKWALAIEYPSHTKLILHPTGPGQSRQIGSGFPYRWASWFSDSRRILAFASEPGKWRRLYVIDATEGTPKVIAHDARLLFRTHPVSPDGRTVFASGLDGSYRVYPVEGGSPRTIPGLAPADIPVRWAPGGRSIFVQTRNQSPARLYAVDVATGRRRLEMEFVPSDRAGLLPGSLLPSANGQVYAFQYARYLSELYLMAPS
jgi:Tol biopolymer transport system component